MGTRFSTLRASSKRVVDLSMRYRQKSTITVCKCATIGAVSLVSMYAGSYYGTRGTLICGLSSAIICSYLLLRKGGKFPSIIPRAWQPSLTALDSTIAKLKENHPRKSGIKLHSTLVTMFLRSYLDGHLIEQLHKSPPGVVHGGDLKRGEHFLAFANSMYGQTALVLFQLTTKSFAAVPPKEFIASYTGLESAEDVLLLQHGHESKEAFSPTFGVCLDHKYKAIVVAIRGTLSLEDALVDLVCDHVAFLKGRAHSGIAALSQRIVSIISPLLIDTLRSYPYTIVVTGHSLGGGAAMLISLLLKDHGFQNVECHSFGSPPVYTPVTPLALEDKFTSWICGFDVVPRLCVNSVHRMLCNLYNLEVSVDFGVKAFVEFARAHPDEIVARLKEQLCETPIDDDSAFLQLRHVGQIVWLHRNHAPTAVVPDFCDNILITDTMIIDHLPKTYVELFNRRHH